MIRIGRKFEDTNLTEWSFDKDGAVLQFVSKEEAIGYLREHEVPEDVISTLIFKDTFLDKIV